MRRCLSSPSFRSALFAFLITRLLILVIFLLATNLRLEDPVPDFGTAVQEPVISLRQPNLAQRMGRAMLYADALWYTDIARLGYEHQPFEATRQHSWAFLPLFPLVYRLAANLTGEYPLTGAILSSIFFLLALIHLHKMIVELKYYPEDANRAVFYLAAFPTSYFFSLPVTESLFLLLSVSSFRSARNDSWWMAGTFGGLAAATRVAGLFLLPVLVIFYWQQHRSDFLKVRLLALLLVPAGILPFMIYLHYITGDALAFLHIQAAWGHSFVFFLKPIWSYIANPLDINMGWDFRLLNFVCATMMFVCGLVLLKRRQWALAVYTLLSVVVPLSGTMLQSLTRYTMVTFPVFIVLAIAGRSYLVDQTIRTVFVILLGLMTALFALHFGMAMS